jgi:diaminopimelate decarboxylase
MPRDLRYEVKQKLPQLAEKYGTPLQIYDEQMIRDNAKHLIQSFRKDFPSFQQFYAVKALPNPAILSILLDEGCGMDCSSTAELYICKQLGIPGDKIIYTSNFTSKVCSRCHLVFFAFVTVNLCCNRMILQLHLIKELS